MSSAVKPVEDGMHTITPHLVCAHCHEAIEFYKKVLHGLAGSNSKNRKAVKKS